MPEDSIRILCTRILEPSQMKRLDEAGIVADYIPLIGIEYTTGPEMRSEITALTRQTAIAIFTSRHAVEAIGEIPGLATAKWTIYCTAPATRKAVAAIFGEDKIAGVADNATGLALKIVKDHPRRKVHFFCSSLRRDELPGILASHDIQCREWKVYHTTEKAKSLSGKYQAAIFFSPSGVRSYFSVNRPDRDIVFFSMGETTSAEIRTFSNNKIVTAGESAVDSLLDLLISFFRNNPKPEDKQKPFEDEQIEK